MQVTRVYWAIVTAGVFLATLSVLFDRPVFLVGAVLVGAFLLSQQYRFIRDLTHLDTTLSITQELSTHRPRTDEPVLVTLSAHRPNPSPLDLTITSEPPVITTSGPQNERTLHLGTDDTRGELSYQLQSGVAGAATVPPPLITVTDHTGLFTETLSRGAELELVVTQRTPRNIHIGEGGQDVSVFGDQTTGRLGTGLIPDSIREYVPGDASSRIDWNVTARLNHPHVREYETETDRMTLLLLDHRHTMTTGINGETKLDYARSIALAFLNTTRTEHVPIGLKTIGTDGLTHNIPVSATNTQYSLIETTLTTLDTTPNSDHPSPMSVRTRPADARRTAGILSSDDSAFGTTLHPYYDTLDPYIHLIESDPLFAAAKQLTTPQPGSLWTVLITDDSHKPELRETVSLAIDESAHVLVFITPTILFEPGGLSDLDTAYNTYLAFEEFRRELGRHEHVTAFELAPGDRLDALLAAHQHRAQHARGATQ